ncbi:sugar nucleotide-binding protein, partial [bacterium]|nr:sugar nucleotide-binding protein [bacterium]
FDYRRHDITDRTGTLRLIKEVRPTFIINAAAMTHVDACEIEREKCWNINVNSVGYLVEGARRSRSKVIHLSSDYVFDGTAGPYTELDRPNPLSYYGKSKHASENIVLGGNVEGAVLRTVVVFGHGRELKPSFVSWLVKMLRERRDVKIVTDQISNVTLVDDLALAVKKIAMLNKEGIWNAAGREILSRYEFAVKIAEAYNLDAGLIQTTLTRLLGQTATRPLQSGLVVDKAQRELNLQFRNVEEALKLYREQEAQLN